MQGRPMVEQLYVEFSIAVRPCVKELRLCEMKLIKGIMRQKYGDMYEWKNCGDGRKKAVFCFVAVDDDRYLRAAGGRGWLSWRGWKCQDCHKRNQGSCSPKIDDRDHSCQDLIKTWSWDVETGSMP